MTNNKVASYAERIERLLDERATIDADIKDIYTEVKAADLKPKVLRKAIANKRRKVDAQFEADVEEYAALLLALPGATYRGVAEQTGIPKSTLQRRVPRKRNGTEPPHDPKTGEMGDGGETENRTQPASRAKGRCAPAPSPDCRDVTMPAAEPEGPAALSSSAEAQSRPDVDSTPPTPMKPEMGAERAHASEPPLHHDHDALAIPAFLRRTA